MLKTTGLIIVFVTLCTFGARAIAADVAISGAWFRALPSGRPAGGYFTMKNSGSASVQLVAAESAVCRMLMLHQTVSNIGTSRMKDVKNVSVPADGTVSFEPGGYHLMCMNPGSAMRPGKSVPVTLVFSDGSKVRVNFTVKNAAGK